MHNVLNITTERMFPFTSVWRVSALAEMQMINSIVEWELTLKR